MTDTAPRSVQSGADDKMVSVVVPFLNEKDTLEALVDRVSAVLRERPGGFEIILIDDGSTDGGDETARALADKHKEVKLIALRRNFGKAAALSAGLGAASGDPVITMDADLQDVPEELPRFIEKAAEGFDVVSGWKKERHDPLSKTLPSKVFNFVLSRAFSLELHDFNCGFKAYSKDAAEQLRQQLYGDLHRFTPALLHSGGFRVAELAVKHEPRCFGYSKFGSGRLVRGLLDLMTVIMLTRYRMRPLHLFGSIGLIIGSIGALGLTYLTVLWLLGLGPIGDRPLLLFSILFSMTGLQFIGIGLIGELIAVSRSKPGDNYSIKPD